MGRFDDKTEKPTARRRNESRKEGQVARSQEVPVAAGMLVAVVALNVIAPPTARLFGDSTRELLALSATGELAIPQLTEIGVRMLLVGVGPILAVAVVSALVSGIGQVGFNITPKAIQPKLSKISPKQGLEKFRPSNAGWELARTALKLGLLILVVMGPVKTMVGKLDTARGLMDGIEMAVSTATTILLRAAALMFVIAATDYGVNRYKHERQLRMSKEDVKQDHKAQDGDPQVKAARRRKAQEMSRNRMLSSVAFADVVITNPTHFAVALKYDQDEGAPRVVAKGVDAMAQKIKREAWRNGVMVIENRPLARGLYRRVKLDAFVPADLYEAVAVVLAMVYRRRGRTAQATAGAVA